LTNIIKVFKKYGKTLIIKGTYNTLLLSAIAVFFGVLIGTILALLKTIKIKPVKFLVNAYVEIIRGTPILVQLYFFYFGLPMLIPSLNLSKFTCIAVALLVNSSAYVSEIIRSGIQAVDKGQMEAGESLGLSKIMVLKEVILPQAIKNILPALGNEFIMMIKETSLASTFLLGDLMSQYKIVSGATYLTFEPLVIVSIVYFVLTFVLSKVFGRFEKRLHAYD